MEDQENSLFIFIRPLLRPHVRKEKEDQEKSLFLLISPVLRPHVRKEKEDQEKSLFPLIRPILLQQVRTEGADQGVIFPLISLVLLPHLRLAEQQRHQIQMQQPSLPLSIPTAVATGTQKYVPFAWSLLQSKKLGLQTLVTTYSVSAVSNNGQRE
jgi:hypothetical protein